MHKKGNFQKIFKLMKHIIEIINYLNNSNRFLRIVDIQVSNKAIERDS